MRYAQIRDMDISNGPGIGVSLFTQGCIFHCPGCHNPEQWNLSGGEEYTLETESKILCLLNRPYIKRLAILGGEPLLERNLSGLAELTGCVSPNKDIWLYTGYTLEELKERCPADKSTPSDLFMILNNVNYIVDGRFEQDKRDVTLAFRGSSNQRIWHRVKQDFFSFPQYEDVTAKFDAGEY